jgi:hypothetical protein
MEFFLQLVITGIMGDDNGRMGLNGQIPVRVASV